jgi:hypothetical protein
MNDVKLIRLVDELEGFDPETADEADLEALGYDRSKGWFVGRRVA